MKQVTVEKIMLSKVLNQRMHILLTKSSVNIFLFFTHPFRIILKRYLVSIVVKIGQLIYDRVLKPKFINCQLGKQLTTEHGYSGKQVNNMYNNKINIISMKR